MTHGRVPDYNAGVLKRIPYPRFVPNEEMFSPCSVMSREDVCLLQHQLPTISQIVRDETWLEGERRGCAVDPHDPVVVARVCEIVQREGAELRRRARLALG